MSTAPHFLSVEDVLTLHAIAIEDQGGNPAILDRAMLESALALPAQQISGEYLHDGIAAMAAAYAFHISKNHAFVDGNKRAAVAAMIAFLSDNGWSFDATADEAELAVLQVTAGTLDKSAFTEWASVHMHEKPQMELRDFFARIDPVQFSNRFLSLLPGETSADPKEFVERVTEAVPAIPFLRDLARQQSDARQSGDEQGHDRITMLAVGMLTLHALAEDMGYEW